MKRTTGIQDWLPLVFVSMFTACLLVSPAMAAKNEAEEKGEKIMKGESEQILSFTHDTVGSVPTGWKAAETNGRNKLAAWKVAEDPTAPGKGKVVTITDNTNSGGTFNLLIDQNANYKDLELTLSLKPLAGGEDQGGGPIWRVKDENNYYVARWNPLENNLNLYFVKDGRRKEISGIRIDTAPKTWHTIKVEHAGKHIEVYFDGKKMLENDDSTFMDAGKIGYWIKADGRSSFDAIKVEKESEDKKQNHEKEAKENKEDKEDKEDKDDDN